MTIEILKLSHVNVTVPARLEDSAKHFYGTLLGLTQVPKPAGSRQNMGAWYQLGDVQLHLSVEENAHSEASDRHVCYLVSDVASTKEEFERAGIEIVPDARPVAGQPRFYVRDPGGNLIEIAQPTK